MDNTWPVGSALGMANHSDAISDSIPRETATKDNRTPGDDRKNGLAHHGSPLPPRFAMMVYRGAWNATTIRFHDARSRVEAAHWAFNTRANGGKSTST
jgi:hypothetical protein